MTRAPHPTTRMLASLVVMALALGACGSGKSSGDTSAPTVEEAGEPVRGGSITYGLEAETGDGWCLPESQLAISGIMVARSVYDTLTAPNAEGDYVPYLAESVEPNDDYTEWTIEIRDGVTFHDGSPLTAEVVKNNLDAYRGQYEGRSALLLLFVLDNIDTIEVTGNLQIVVTTKVPWVAFPAFLHYSGRLGIIGQAQLDDPDRCDRDLIGTGPFKLASWETGREFVAERNPEYWQMAPDGEPYPYLDEIRFRPVEEAEQRVNALESGGLDILHASDAPSSLTLTALADDGVVVNRDSNLFAEVGFTQVNTSKPPLDDERVRRALVLSIDREDYKEVINRGLFTRASGPFAEGATGYLEDAGYPTEQDIEEAKDLIAQYEAEKGPLPRLTYQTGTSSSAQQVAVYVQQAYEAIGVGIEITNLQQDKLIDNAINGDFDFQAFRNYPGGDPDELYVWWKSTSPINFGRIDDPEIDRLLDEGRSEPDPEARALIYEDLNRRFGEQLWSFWSSWTTWRVSSDPQVFGYTLDTLPKLPDGSDPFPGLSTGHPTLGLWTTA